MFDIRKVENDSIIICPSSIKKFLLKTLSLNPSLNIKLLSKEELINGTTFNYGSEALIHLFRKGFTLDNASELIDNLKYYKLEINQILDEEYNDLFKNYLLEYNHYFKYLFLNKKIYVYGYSKKDRLISKSLKKIGVNYTYLEQTNNKYSHDLYYFYNQNEELIFLFNKIGNLIEKGISLNNIKIFSYPSEYSLPIKKQMELHNIPFEDNERVCLKDSPVFKMFMRLYEDFSLEEAFEKTKEYFSDDTSGVLDSIVKIDSKINYLEISKEERRELFTFYSKNTYLSKKQYDESIKIVDEYSYISPEDYVFILGFSLGQYPKINKDNDFLTDKEKELSGINTSSIENEISKEILSNFILGTKNLFISFKERIGNNVYYLSPLVDKLQMKQTLINKSNIRYSHKVSKLEVAKYKDLKKAYGVDNEYIDTYTNKEIEYLEYNHHFKKDESFKNNQKMMISYSAIDDYFNCPFSYFLKRVLKVDEFETNFSINLGNFMHLLLEDSLKKEIRLENYSKEFDDLFKLEKERYFARKLIEQTFYVLTKNDMFKTHSKYTNWKGETKIYYSIDENTTLQGQVDKIMFNDEDKEVAIVDYKTGAFAFHKEKIHCGLNMQLPIYAILSKKEYPEYRVTGLYIQHLLEKELLTEKKYMLDGLTIYDDEVFAHLDENYLDSSYVLGLKYVKKYNGVALSNHVILESELDSIINLTRNKLLEAIKNIREGLFPIRPIKDNTLSCEYCEFKDICYMEMGDALDLKKALEQIKKEDN